MIAQKRNVVHIGFAVYQKNTFMAMLCLVVIRVSVYSTYIVQGNYILALGQSSDWLSASEGTMMMGKRILLAEEKLITGPQQCTAKHNFGHIYVIHCNHSVASSI